MKGCNGSGKEIAANALLEKAFFQVSSFMPLWVGTLLQAERSRRTEMKIPGVVQICLWHGGSLQLGRAAQAVSRA